MAAKRKSKYRRNSLPRLIDRWINHILRNLGNGEMKVTVTDLTRLIALRRELVPLPPLQVRWID